MKKLFKKIKDYFFPVGTLTSKLKYHIDTDYDLWVEESGYITLWWSIDKKFWEFHNGCRLVLGHYYHDELKTIRGLYSFARSFKGVEEAIEFAEKHPRLIDLYREYCKDLECLKGKQEYRKAVAKDKREKALATAYNNQ